MRTCLDEVSRHGETAPGWHLIRHKHQMSRLTALIEPWGNRWIFKSHVISVLPGLYLSLPHTLGLPEEQQPLPWKRGRTIPHMFIHLPFDVSEASRGDAAPAPKALKTKVICCIGTRHAAPTDCLLSYEICPLFQLPKINHIISCVVVSKGLQRL